MTGTISVEQDPGAANGATAAAEGGLEVSERIQHTFKAPAPRTSLLGESFCLSMALQRLAVGSVMLFSLENAIGQLARFVAGLDVLAKQKREEAQANQGSFPGSHPVNMPLCLTTVFASLLTAYGLQASARVWRWQTRRERAAMLKKAVPQRAAATAVARLPAAVCCRTGSIAASEWRRHPTQVWCFRPLRSSHCQAAVCPCLPGSPRQASSSSVRRRS